MNTDVNTIEGLYLRKDRVTRVSKAQMRKRKRIAKIKRISIECILGILLIFSISFILMSWLDSNIPIKYEGEYITYTVSKGERLWNIAEKVSENRDIREVVYIIEKDNNLDSANLSIGQELKIRSEY